jgi:4-amino-4-deoxy-L-arabinose transferase-like glycosyltransferase
LYQEGNVTESTFIRNACGLIERIARYLDGKKPVFWILFGILVCSIALTGLNGSLQNIDEVLYSRVARETFEKSSWLIQYKDSEAWFHKSPMLFWGIMTSYRLFGVSDFSAKLPSAVASIISAFMILFISRKVFSRTGAGVIAAFIYLCSIQVYASTHQVATDSLLVASLLTTLYFLIRGVSERPSWLLLCAVLNGIVFLTKSIFGMVIPVVLFIYIIANRRWALFPYLVLMLVISVGMAAPYFIYVYRTIPEVFLETFLQENLIQRFHTGGEVGIGSYLLRLPYGIGYYAVVLFLFLLPFTPGLFFLFGFKKSGHTAGEILWGERSSVVSIYFLVVLFGYSLLEGHWLHWSMTMIPAASIMLGRVLDGIRRKGFFLATAALGTAVIAVFVYALVTLADTYPTYKDVVIGLIAAYAVLVLASVIFYLDKAPVGRKPFFLAAVFFIVFTVETAITVPLDFNHDLKRFGSIVYDDPSPFVVVSTNRVNEGNKTTATIWYLKMDSTQYGSLEKFRKASDNIEEGTYVMFDREDTENIRSMFDSFDVLMYGRIWNLGRIIEK